MKKNDDTASRCDEELKKLENVRKRFPNQNFVNQKWEILNFIAAFRYRGHTVCVSDVYHALDYPRESVIRTIEALALSGLVIKIEDKYDKRRKNLVLSDNTKNDFAAIFDGP